MFYSWLPMLLIVAGSLVTGSAITRACGQEKWWGIEPAVGFAALMAVEGLLARPRYLFIIILATLGVIL